MGPSMAKARVRQTLATEKFSCIIGIGKKELHKAGSNSYPQSLSAGTEPPIEQKLLIQ